jgi:hypothetical protein
MLPRGPLNDELSQGTKPNQPNLTWRRDDRTIGLVSLDVSGCLVHRTLAVGTLAVYYSPSSINCSSIYIHQRGECAYRHDYMQEYRRGYIALSWEVRAR